MAGTLSGISKALGNLGGILGGGGFNPASVIGSLGGPAFPTMTFPGLQGLLGSVLRGAGPSMSGTGWGGAPITPGTSSMVGLPAGASNTMNAAAAAANPAPDFRTALAAMLRANPALGLGGGGTPGIPQGAMVAPVQDPLNSLGGSNSILPVLAALARYRMI